MKYIQYSLLSFAAFCIYAGYLENKRPANNYCKLLEDGDKYPIGYQYISADNESWQQGNANLVGTQVKTIGTWQYRHWTPQEIDCRYQWAPKYKE
jgi:hypothetical protein